MGKWADFQSQVPGLKMMAVSRLKGEKVEKQRKNPVKNLGMKCIIFLEVCQGQFRLGACDAINKHSFCGRQMHFCKGSSQQIRGLCPGIL